MQVQNVICMFSIQHCNRKRQETTQVSTQHRVTNHIPMQVLTIQLLKIKEDLYLNMKKSGYVGEAKIN